MSFCSGWVDNAYVWEVKDKKFFIVKGKWERVRYDDKIMDLWPWMFWSQYICESPNLNNVFVLANPRLVWKFRNKTPPLHPPGTSNPG